MNREECYLFFVVMCEWVLDELEWIECEYDVVVFYVCELGSWVWGFVLLDSDYDVCFVYVYQFEWYQCVEEFCDVIECLLSDELDISGWELCKVLCLMCKFNLVLLEWFGLLLVYWEEFGVCEELFWLGSVFYFVLGSCYYYLLMVCKNYWGYLKGDSVWLKKYFYVLCLLFVVCWLDVGLGLLLVVFERLVEVMLDDLLLCEELDVLLSFKCQCDELVYGFLCLVL